MEKQMYTVYVNDNYHYMDESERYKLGEFETYQAAVKAAKEVVESSVASAHKKGMTAEELLKAYKMFGDDPYIVPDDAQPTFSAWTYAEERCEALCRDRS